MNIFKRDEEWLWPL